MMHITPILTNGRRRLVACFVLAAVTLSLILPCPQAQARAKQPPTAVEATANLQRTPEGALRAFLASMIGPDIATLRHVILPVSDADFQYLVNQKPVPPNVRDLMVSRIASMDIRSLKPGDTIPLPNGKSFQVQKGDVGSDHVLLQMQGGPLPVLLRKVHGLWYVNAKSIIAARKAAAVVRQKMAHSSKAH